MRWAYLFLLSFVLVGHLIAQPAKCSDVIAKDPAMPIYPPIARAAHVEGTVRFAVTLSPELKAEVKFLDGPQFLAGAAQTYIEGRRYYWTTEGQYPGCTYTAEIEYRIIPPQSDDPNNFLRVTILGLNHALIEVQPIKPTCNDCKDFRCPLNGVTESNPLIYPAIARAAHVEGDVSARLTFNAKGQVIEVADWTGPAMFREPTIDYLRSWRLTSMQPYMDSCQATILIEYRLTSATEVVASDSHVYKADPAHILVEDHAVLIVDPAATIEKRKKFLGIF